MAKAISNEELQLRKRARRRLVGAIALVVMVVVFVPMILDNEPKPVSQDIEINISTPSPEAEDNAASSAEPEPLRFRPIEQESDEASGESASQTQDNAAPEEAAPAASAPATKPISKPATETRVAAANEQFVVQLGAFSNAENASRLAAKVRENRFTAYTEVVSTDGGKRTRVRVGPYPTRADAQQASERLKARKLTYGEPVIVRLTD